MIQEFPSPSKGLGFHIPVKAVDFTLNNKHAAHFKINLACSKMDIKKEKVRIKETQILKPIIQIKADARSFLRPGIHDVVRGKMKNDLLLNAWYKTETDPEDEIKKVIPFRKMKSMIPGKQA